MAGPTTDGRRRNRSSLFANDLKALLYAFGDVANPYPETVMVLEDILQEYLIATCQEAQRVARAASRSKLKVEDFKFALRNDPRKLGRVEKLLQMQKEIEEARRTYDYSEGKALARLHEVSSGSATNYPASDTNGAGNEASNSAGAASTTGGKNGNTSSHSGEFTGDQDKNSSPQLQLPLGMPKVPGGPTAPGGAFSIPGK